MISNVSEKQIQQKKKSDTIISVSFKMENITYTPKGPQSILKCTDSIVINIALFSIYCIISMT